MNDIQNYLAIFVKQYGIDIVWIIILFIFGRLLLRLAVKRLIKMVDDGDESNVTKKEKRAETLGNIIITTGDIVIYVVLLLMVLSLFNVDIRPILASAGVVGLAIGFGAQSLVKDFVSGLFILVEDQYGIGDKVKIGSHEGKVIRITMRSTVLRDDEGKNYYISNGSINNVMKFPHTKNHK